MTPRARHFLLGAACALVPVLTGCGAATVDDARPAAAVPVADTGPSDGNSTLGPTATTTVTAGPAAPDLEPDSAQAQTTATQTSVEEGLRSLPRPFAAQSPWNTPVTNSPAASNSARLIALAQQRFGVVQGHGLAQVTTGRRTIRSPLYINTTIWTDPIIISNSGTQTLLVCRQVNLSPPDNDCGDGWNLHTLAIPRIGFPKPQYDGWLTVIDPAADVAYDFWRARLAPGGSTMTYQFVRRWNLNGPGFLPPGYPGARGSGLPLFAGEITPHDIASGRIDHVLAISVPGPAATFYVQPASATDGNGRFGSLPEGSRLRLKASVSTSAALRALPGQTNVAAARAIITALRSYGAIVVDRARVPTLYAVPDYDWSRPLRSAGGLLLSPNGHTPLTHALQSPTYATPILNGNEIRGLRLSDFEVLRLPPLLEFPSTGANPLGGLDGIAPQPVSGDSAAGGSQTSSAQAGGIGDGSETP